MRRLLSVSYSYHNIVKDLDHIHGGLLLTCPSFMLSRQMDPYLMDTQLSISVTALVFLLHVSKVDTYMIITMNFIATVMVHIAIVNVVRTFVPSYTLLLLRIVPSRVSQIILQSYWISTFPAL